MSDQGGLHPAQQAPDVPHPRFPHLFSPLKIGPYVAKNRIVNSPHATGFAHDGGYTDRLVAYHRERAKGGAAILCSQGTYVIPNEGDLRNADESVIPWYQKVAEAVHAYGARYVAELSHAGRQGRYRGPYSELVWGPSAVPGQPYGKTWRIPHELDGATIRQIIKQFGEAAKRCQAGGIDGIELHFAHGNLAEQFMDPATNRRTDEWGGSLENRLRFAREVIREIREAVGRGMSLGARVTGGDPDRQGLSQLEMMEVCGLLDELEMLDYLSISMGHYSGMPHVTYNIPDSSFGPATWRKYAAAIKDVVRVPVFMVGRINHPQLAEDLLARGECDMVVLGRTLMADPYFPLKAFSGQVEEIRPCTGAQACWYRYHTGRGIRCIYNPMVGMESEWEETPPPAETRQRVVVVGGGMAGLEAARIAALRGHQVTVLEREQALGGQIRLAAKVPLREELGQIVDWLRAQCEKLGVELKLGAEATAEAVLALDPEAVVVATGGHPRPLDVVISDGGQLVDAWEVLAGRVETGARVLVFDETGRRQGLGVADLLATAGKSVHFVTPLIYPGMDIDPIGFQRTYQRLAERGVVFTPLSSVTRIAGRRVTLKHVYSGLEQSVDDVDTVVASMLPAAQDSLYRALEGKVSRLELAGDAFAPRFGEDATFEGHRAGLAV